MPALSLTEYLAGGINGAWVEGSGAVLSRNLRQQATSLYALGWRAQVPIKQGIAVDVSCGSRSRCPFWPLAANRCQIPQWAWRSQGFLTRQALYDTIVFMPRFGPAKLLNQRDSVDILFKEGAVPTDSHLGG